MPRCRLDALLALRQAFRALQALPMDFDLPARLTQPIRLDSARRRPAFSPLRSGWFPTDSPRVPVARVFDPVPPGGLCAAAELCGSLGSVQ